jgi:hypothetical protein
MLIPSPASAGITGIIRLEREPLSWARCLAIISVPKEATRTSISESPRNNSFQIPVRNASTLPLDLVDQLDLHVAQRSEDPASQPTLDLGPLASLLLFSHA